nr:MAG TPA: hypothetical protein [Caudoviricetes sp.]
MLDSSVHWRRLLAPLLYSKHKAVSIEKIS